MQRRHFLTLMTGAVTLPVFTEPAFSFTGVVRPRSWIAFDRISQSYLGGDDIKERISPASMTKILLIGLVFDALKSGYLHWDQPLVASIHSSQQPASKLALKIGQQIPLKWCLVSVCASSCNDSAVMLAEALYQSESKTVEAMNIRARDLGMKDSYFGNCTGLEGSGNYSTVYDIALALNYILTHHQSYTGLLCIPSWNFDGRLMRNTDHMVGEVSGLYCSKTGYTKPAGFCLASAFKSENRDVLSVVSGMPSANSRNTWVHHFWSSLS